MNDDEVKAEAEFERVMGLSLGDVRKLARAHIDPMISLVAPQDGPRANMIMGGHMLALMLACHMMIRLIPGFMRGTGMPPGQVERLKLMAAMLAEVEADDESMAAASASLHIRRTQEATKEERSDAASPPPAG